MGLIRIPISLIFNYIKDKESQPCVIYIKIHSNLTDSKNIINYWKWSQSFVFVVEFRIV